MVVDVMEVALLFAVFDSPPPLTQATLTMVAGADADTFTVTTIGG